MLFFLLIKFPKRNKIKERSESVGTVIAAIIIIAVNFLTTLLALTIAIKSYAKTLTAIVDECEKADRDKVFWEA